MTDLAERILAACDRCTMAGQRDYAILCLLIGSSLKRQQVAAVSIRDFNYNQRSLQIQRRYKHQNQQNPSEIISLTLDTADALQDWLNLIHIADDISALQAPLFISLDRAKYGHRLTGTAIYGIVKRAATKAGIAEAIAPEQLRFSREKYALNQDIETQSKTIDETGETHLRSPMASKLVSKLDYENQDRTHFDTHETQISAIPYALTEFQPDILNSLLSDKRSLNTRRAYEKDLRYFFLAAYGQKPTESVIAQFLRLNRFEAIAIALRYKSDLITQGLKESTINRRLSALKSLVNFAAKLGKCEWNLNDVQTETVQTYRDTTGIKPESIRAMLLKIDRTTIKGKRDFAILRLLWDNALRRNEVVSANIGDFDGEGRSLQILGKGRGSQKSLISLSLGTSSAIQDWLSQIETQNSDRPLFQSLDPANYGHRLTGTAIYQIVDLLAKDAGIAKKMSPHRIRHSAITAALDATNGNVRKVQKLSRHKKLDTLMLYDDNRTNMQGELSNLLSDLI
ncbi:MULTISPECIES: tyrosine-type recombinase/integrase [Pseudanabaena]|uniref:Integrase family protein n=2 Tax=Pseudanabaena TaxID=1152 RepID=L8N1D4_9CYAN|nr:MULTISPECIES: tyrosine-type recombinase/integrase [Pseudanabaena]ELS32864.1 integrase family protein [Pseudanabaena biceps PCC 7429]MDG3494916.1 tyrosine-type recombinase/integrase [Pseudanabaena catenata USMAC16]